LIAELMNDKEINEIYKMLVKITFRAQIVKNTSLKFLESHRKKNGQARKSKYYNG